MRIHYQGKFNRDPASLPHGEHQPGAVAFREPKDPKTLGLIANGVALVLMVLLYIPFFGVAAKWMATTDITAMLAFPLACFVALLCAIPHEFLHAICFREDAYIYTNLKQGMLFVVGPECMSRARFIFMSLLPNLVFGVIPYLVALVLHQPVLGFFGALSVSMGSGDYLNVFNALTQMPRGAKTYLYGFHSYWYMPASDR